MSQPSPSRGVCSRAVSELGSWRNKARVPGKAECLHFTGQRSAGLPGAHKIWQPAPSLPRVCCHIPPFLRAPREYLLRFSAVFCLKCLRVPQTAGFGFLQPQESICPLLWGEEGTCLSCFIPGKMDLWGCFSAGKHLSAPSFLCMYSSPGAANNLGNGGFGKTLTQAHPNTSGRVCR